MFVVDVYEVNWLRASVKRDSYACNISRWDIDVVNSVYVLLERFQDIDCSIRLRVCMS